MRFIIIGLSIIFFTLSALIMYRAIELPVQTPIAHTPLITVPPTEAPVTPKSIDQTQNEESITEPDVVVENSTAPIEQSDSGAAKSANQEVNVAHLENQVVTSDEKSGNNKIMTIENHPTILTIFGGQTFRSGQAIINDTAASKIEKLINEISVFPNSQIIIEGHTDNIPTGKLHRNNMDLSIRRAKAIADILISRGIPPESISVIGYGDTRPIDTNRTEQGRAKNRRVEVKLLLKEGEN